MSKKREKETIAYRLAVEEWKRKQISKDGYWQCNFKGKPYGEGGYDWPDDQRCVCYAVDVHHRRGRGKWFTYSRYFMGLCRFHHDFIHQNPREARKRRYLLT